MKKATLAAIACMIVYSASHLGAQPAKTSIDDYVPGPDSKSQPGVPTGKTFSFPFENSKIFPGTSRNIAVYVPAQYKGDKPACVYVGLDSLGFGVPVVFDNLIHQGAMPVTIAVGISSGTVSSISGQNPRFNRSFEFDGLNDSLARFVIEEVLPEVEKRRTPDELPIRLSQDPNDRCTGGASTGGIAAFTLAWERPDQFRRVFSAIGTFVGMRGGDRYPVLVRKTEPKPIRVFQQDGENDQWMGGPEVGDWWMGNVTLQRSLKFAGYDHQHVWGTGPHSGKHATAIFPDAMRYLWKDWPTPIKARIAESQNVLLKGTLDPESTWELVGAAGDACDHLAVNPQGEVFFHDVAAKRTKKLGIDGTIGNAANVPADTAFSFAGDGGVVTLTDINATDINATDINETDIHATDINATDINATDINATCLTTNSRGHTYATDGTAGKVWLVKLDGSRMLLDEGLKHPAGIALSPDGLWLAVMESHTHWGYSYRVKSDGTVDLKQRFYWTHVPDWADDSGAGSMCMDRDGHPYVATHMGVQIYDRNGRSRGILPMPTGTATSVCFGGEKFETLFVTSGGKLYRRHMKAVGAPSFIDPIKLPRWGGG